MIEYKPIRHHITRRDGPVRLCDGRPATDEDILIGDMEALRGARGEAILCPTCQLNSGHQPFSLRPSRHAYGRQTLSYLFALPVQDAFDNIRNCPHCREKPADRTCKAWQEARKRVGVMHKEARGIAREVDELPEVTGGISATLYQFADGSVGYFALAAPPWQEAGEITGVGFEQALLILENHWETTVTAWGRRTTSRRGLETAEGACPHGELER